MVFVTPNLRPDGVVRDIGWIGAVSLTERSRNPGSRIDREPDPREQYHGIQVGQSREAQCSGREHRLRDGRQNRLGAHVEMADMVAAGMTPAQVIVAATRTSAEILRLTDVRAIRQERGFHRAGRESAGRHHQHAPDHPVYLRGAEVDRAAVRARLTSSN